MKSLLGKSVAIFITLVIALSNGAAGYSGQVTYYDAGLGSCGNTNSNSEYIAAISAADYDASKCGCSANICYKSNCITVQIVDRCVGCASGDLDVTPTAFKALVGSLDAGRVPISWTLNCGSSSNGNALAPVAQTTPAVVQATTPVVEATPVVLEATIATTPVIQTTPVVQTTPVIQTTPAVQTTSVVQETTVATTTSSESAATPTISNESLVNSTSVLNTTSCYGDIKQNATCNHDSDLPTCSGVYFAICNTNNEWLLRSCSDGTVCKPFRAGFGCAAITVNDTRVLNATACPLLI